MTMSEKDYEQDSILEMFGLTFEQSRLLFSIEKMIAEYDADYLKSDKASDYKRKWISAWEKGVTDYLTAIDKTRNAQLMNIGEISQSVNKEMESSPNRTWYYIIVLECLAFTPYTNLGTEDDDKKYKKCKYNDKKSFKMLKDFFDEQGYLTEEKIERLHNVYEKSLNQISGKTNKMAMGAVAVVAIAALFALGAAIAAPEIAALLVGSTFEGLYGIALTNACLALVGSGVAAVTGSTAMLGGVITIAGGGALLGIAGGGTAVGIASKVLSASPDYTLTQAAKLETILKEVILNAQQDVVAAQKIINIYREQINSLNKEITKLEVDNDKNKQALKNLKLSIKYLKKSCQDMNSFTSAYEIGINTEA